MLAVDPPAGTVTIARETSHPDPQSEGGAPPRRRGHVAGRGRPRASPAGRRPYSSVVPDPAAGPAQAHWTSQMGKHIADDIRAASYLGSKPGLDTQCRQGARCPTRQTRPAGEPVFTK